MDSCGIVCCRLVCILDFFRVFVFCFFGNEFDAGMFAVCFVFHRVVYTVKWNNPHSCPMSSVLQRHWTVVSQYMLHFVTFLTPALERRVRFRRYCGWRLWWIVDLRWNENGLFNCVDHRRSRIRALGKNVTWSAKHSRRLGVICQFCLFALGTCSFVCSGNLFCHIFFSHLNQFRPINDCRILLRQPE